MTSIEEAFKKERLRNELVKNLDKADKELKEASRGYHISLNLLKTYGGVYDSGLEDALTEGDPVLTNARIKREKSIKEKEMNVEKDLKYVAKCKKEKEKHKLILENYDKEENKEKEKEKEKKSEDKEIIKQFLVLCNNSMIGDEYDDFISEIGEIGNNLDYTKQYESKLILIKYFVNLCTKDISNDSLVSKLKSIAFDFI